MADGVISATFWPRRCQRSTNAYAVIGPIIRRLARPRAWRPDRNRPDFGSYTREMGPECSRRALSSEMAAEHYT